MDNDVHARWPSLPFVEWKDTASTLHISYAYPTPDGFDDATVLPEAA